MLMPVYSHDLEDKKQAASLCPMSIFRDVILQCYIIIASYVGIFAYMYTVLASMYEYLGVYMHYVCGLVWSCVAAVYWWVIPCSARGQ